MRRGRLVGVALSVALGVVVLGAEPAGAQTPTGPAPAGSTPIAVPPVAAGPSAPGPAVGPGFGPGVPPALGPAPGPAAEDGAGPAGRSIIPDSDVGAYPTSHYDVGYDAGAWDNIGRKFFGLLTELAFGVNRWLVGVGLWITPWAYGFGVVGALGDPALALALAEVYITELVGPAGLRHAAFFYAVAWAGWQGLRGRLRMAAGELALTALVAVFGGFVLADPAGYLGGAFDVMGRASGSFLVLGTGAEAPDGPGSAEAALRPLNAHLHAAFIEQPHDYIDWGGPLTGACAAARDALLAEGPHGADDEPREAMRAAGCAAAADFNADPTAERLGGSLLTTLAAATVVVLLVLVAVTLLVAQVMAVLLFAVAPLALVSGLLPGAGRELLWRWVAALVRSALAVVGMSFVLSMLLLVVDGLLGATEGAGLIERFALLVLTSVGMLVVRRRAVGAGARLAERMATTLSAARVGGRGSTRGGGWLAPAAVGGVSGWALGASAREAGGELPGHLGTRVRTAGQHPHWRARRPPGRPGVTTARTLTAVGAGSPGSGGLTSAGARLGATRPARVVSGAGRLAVGGAAAAYKSTLGLPVHGPRAYREVAGRTSAASARVRATLADYSAEYAGNVATAARVLRRREDG